MSRIRVRPWHETPLPGITGRLRWLASMAMLIAFLIALSPYLAVAMVGVLAEAIIESPLWSTINRRYQPIASWYQDKVTWVSSGPDRGDAYWAAVAEDRLAAQRRASSKRPPRKGRRRPEFGG